MVDWLVDVTGNLETSVRPVEKQSPYNLKWVSCYSYTKWQLRDWCLLPNLTEISSKEDVLRFGRTGATKTTVDIHWQDGTKVQGLASKSLAPIIFPGEHDFFPHQYVTNRAVDGVLHVGVVQSSDVKGKTATVRWFKNRNLTEIYEEEVISVYELKHHLEYGYRYGELVVRSSREPEDQKNGERDWVGTVTGLREMKVEVTWVDGTVSLSGPQCIELVGNLLDDEILESSTESKGDSCMTTPSSSSSDEEKKKLTKILLEDPIEDIKLEDEIDSKRYGRNEGIAILPRLVRFVAGMFSGKSEDSFTQLLDVNNNDSSNFKGFRFDTKPPDDHYYLSNKTTFTKQLAKKIGFDYAILNKSLPDGIYVCAYESRLDLLRAAIIGAQATPYENGMFFFDLHLHSDYPNSPPSIRHHSRGEKVNPNLNADGTICLSLLGTWKGEKNESWTPSSTLLQLLISIQALVLNMKPYFNEAGHDTLVGTSEGEKSSLAYNEYAFLTNIKLMTLHMQKKPQGFEDVIEDHFRRRGPYIRKACEQYLRSGSHSQGFQQSLESLMLNLYPCLDEPLEDYGSKKPYQNEMMTSADRVKGEHREDYDTKNPFRNEMTGSASRVPRFTLNEDDAEEDEEEKQGIVSQDATVSKIF